VVEIYNMRRMHECKVGNELTACQLDAFT